MAIKFDFKKIVSPILGTIFRPVAQVDFRQTKGKKWIPVGMIVDTGADYTLLPKWYAKPLEIDLVNDCKVFETAGVGGSERVYLCKKKIKVKLGKWERDATIGLLDSDRVPPLLGRFEFMETFKTTFHKHKTVFEEDNN